MDNSKCRTYYNEIGGDFTCPNDNVKSDAPCDWGCAWAYLDIMINYNCNDRCGKYPDPTQEYWMWRSCQSFTAMYTTVCTATAAEITTKVEELKKNNMCKNTSAGGVEFGPGVTFTTAPVAGTTTPAPVAGTTTPAPTVGASSSASSFFDRTLKTSSVLAIVFTAMMSMCIA